jgi:membrane protease YdiL (CAAX protease family)
VAGGVAFGVAFKLLLKAVVMPLLGAAPINQRYHYLAGNRAAIPATLFALVIGAGVGEETVFRGYMFERLGRLFGHGGAARTAIVLVTAALFAVAHLADQGVAGAEQAAIVGLVFGAIYATTGRLFGLMVAHAAFDLAAYALIYWNLEPAVAHAIFR